MSYRFASQMDLFHDFDIPEVFHFSEDKYFFIRLLVSPGLPAGTAAVKTIRCFIAWQLTFHCFNPVFQAVYYLKHGERRRKNVFHQDWFFVTETAF